MRDNFSVDNACCFFLTSIQFPASGSPKHLLEMPALPNVMAAFVRIKALTHAWPVNQLHFPGFGT